MPRSRLQPSSTSALTVARLIASGDSPRWQGIAAAPDDLKFDQLWDELSKLVAIESWRALMQISGQLVEALVKHRLSSEGITNVDKKTLGPLIQIARAEGILQDSSSIRLVDSTLSAAVILRNWSSHYSVYHRNPDATQAAQALVLLLATSEALFPLYVPERTDVEMDKITLSSLLTAKNIHGSVIWFSRLPKERQVEIVQEGPDALAARIARDGSARAIVTYEALLASCSLPSAPFRNALSREFSSVVRNISRSSFRTLIEALLAMRRLDLHAYASSAGILLPSDPAFLTELLESRPSAYVALYLAECTKANRGAISARFGNPANRKTFVESFWSTFGSGEENIINAANILKCLPVVVAAEIFRRSPKQSLLKWVGASDPANSINLLWSLSPYAIERNADLRSLREALSDAIADTIATADIVTAARLPLRLHQMKSTHAAHRKILIACLEKAKSSDHWYSVRRIIWDIYCFFPESQKDAIEVAQQVLEDRGLAIPIWERMCLLGLLTLARAEPPAARQWSGEADRAALPQSLPQETDRWQSFLFAVGVVSAGSEPFIAKIPRGIVESLEARLAATAPPSLTPSASLLRAAADATQSIRARLTPR